MSITLPAWTKAQLTVLAAAFLGLSSGYVCSYGGTMTTFIVPLTGEFGWGRAIPSLMYAAGTAGAAVSSLLLGRLIDAFGPVRIASVSAVLLSGVFVGLATMQGNVVLAALLGLAAGLLGAGTGVGLYVSLVPKVFHQDLGKALGIAIVGQSIGLGLFPFLTNWMIANNGWRAAYVALAVVQLGITLLAILTLARVRHLPALSARHATSEVDAAEATSHSRRDFWTLCGAIGFATIGTLGTVVQLFPLYIDKGIDHGSLHWLALAIGAGALLGRVLSGYCLDVFEPRTVGSAIFLAGACAIGMLMLPLADTALAFAPALLISFALGAETDVLAFCAKRLFGVRGYASTYNRLLIGYYIGAICGPALVGASLDLGIGWQPTLACLATSLIAASIIFRFLPAMRQHPVSFAG